MSYEMEEQAVHDRIKTLWANRTPIKFGTSPFTAPTDEAKQYIAVWLQAQESTQIDIGTNNPMVRYPGRVVVQVFGNDKFGARPLKRLADQVGAIFSRQVLTLAQNGGTMHFGVPTAIEQPSMLSYAQINVDIPFRRDTRTS